MQHRWGRRLVRVPVASAAVVTVVLLSAGVEAGAGEPAPNAPIVVTTTADVVDAGDGETSLREAVALSEAQAGHDEIVLLADEVHPVSTCEIDGTTIAIEDEAGVTITGNGATIDTACPGRLLDLGFAGPSQVQDLTLTGDAGADGSEVAWIGDGQLVDVAFIGFTGADEGSMVLLTDGASEALTFRGNQGFDVLLHLWGGEQTSPRVDGVTLTDNGAGLGVASETATVVTGVLARGNHFAHGAVGLPAGSSLEGSALVGNTGVGLRGYSLPSSPAAATLDVVNTTVAVNWAADEQGGGILSEVPLALTHVTLFDNIGEAVYGYQIVAPELTSFGSVVTTSYDGPLCDVDATTSLGWNVDDGTCAFDRPTDRTLRRGAALLSEPDDVGTTATARPRPGSPLIDAIPTAVCTLDVDQRGVDRPQGPGCDIGAHEVDVAFPDVPGGHPFNPEITWLAGQQITGGYADGTYRPAAPVSRGAMAAFLHRFAGDDPVTLPPTPTFRDVALTHPFAADIEWLASQQITGGYADGTYRPAAPVSRGAMAAFLHRLAALA